MLRRIRTFLRIPVWLTAAFTAFAFVVGAVAEELITVPVNPLLLSLLLLSFLVLVLAVMISYTAEVGERAKRLGIFGITEKWTDFTGEFVGTFGKRFQEKLEEDLAKAKGDVTWYLVTINPHAFLEWDDTYLNPEAHLGIHVKWVYHSLGSLEEQYAIKAQWEWINSKWSEKDYRKRSGKDGVDELKTKISDAERLAKRFASQIKRMNDEERAIAGSWELYESRIPHFYLAFLSVPWKHPRPDEAIPIHAPRGTYGFVHLYYKFAADYAVDAQEHGNYHSRPGLYLEAPGTMLDYYFWSTVRLFHDGVKRGYLQRTWPLQT